MESQCLLCDQPMGIGGIGSTVRAGNAENPDFAMVCIHCAALRPEERRLLRNQAMLRMLRNGSDPSGAPPAPRPSSCTVISSPLANFPVEASRLAAGVAEVRSRAIEGIATLFDGIRASVSGPGIRILVFCGASTAEGVGRVAGDLVAHAERHGMNTLLGVVTSAGGRPLLVPNPVGSALPVELESVSTVDLHAWARRIAPGTKLVVIAGPPLADSIDSALLACAGDGLVIVAESEVTERAALKIAAERACLAGCRTLGVVMYGTKDRMPGWLSRLVRDGEDWLPDVAGATLDARGASSLLPH